MAVIAQECQIHCNSCGNSVSFRDEGLVHRALWPHPEDCQLRFDLSKSVCLLLCLQLHLVQIVLQCLDSTCSCCEVGYHIRGLGTDQILGSWAPQQFIEGILGREAQSFSRSRWCWFHIYLDYVNMPLGFSGRIHCAEQHHSICTVT